MILKGTLGENWGGIDRYATRQKHARMLVSNFGGDTLAERMREATALRSSRPNLKKVVGHIILSHDPELADLTDQQWLVAIELAKLEHDLRDAAFCAVLHQERKHRHVHLYYVRVRPDGSVVSDSQSYPKNSAAARRIEQELGLPPPTPVPKEKKPGDRKRSDNATRRGRRKQETQGEVFMDNVTLKTLTFKALASASTPEAFDLALAAEGVETEWSPNRAGLKFKPIGASTWQKGSTVDRELSGAKIIAALQRNAELRQAAEQASASSTATADGRAKVLTAPRIDRNEALDDVAAATGVTSRVLPLPEANAARAQAAAGPLDFLAPVEQAPAELDDALLDPGRAEREAAEAELDLKLRKLEVAALYDLKSFQVAPIWLTAEQITALVNLVVKIATFGVVKRANVFAESRLAQKNLAARADQEIQRRKRTPTRVVERLKILAIQEAAAKDRQLKLSARASNNWAIPPLQEARVTTERRRDAAATRAGVKTIFSARADLAAAQAKEVARAEQVTAAEAAVPLGFAGVLSSASTVTRSARARLAELREQQAKDQHRRERTAAALEEMIDSFEAKFAAEIQAEKEQIEASRAAAAEEISRLQIELRTTIPLERKTIAAGRDDAELELGHPGRQTDADHPPVDADADSDAERERLRLLAGKGG